MDNNTQMVIDANTLSLEHRAKGAIFNEQGSQLAVNLFAGLYQEASDGYYLWSVPTWESFTTKWAELANEGLRLIDIDTYQNAGYTSFTGVWRQGSEGYALWRTPDWNSFYQIYQQNLGTMRLVDFDIELAGVTRWYTGVWLGSPVKQQLLHGLTWNEFEAKWKDLSEKQGYRLSKAQVFYSDGALRYAGLFEAGSGAYAFYSTSDWNQFMTIYKKQSIALVDFNVFHDGTNQWYTGVWRQISKKHQFIYGLDWGSFVANWEEWNNRGYRLRAIEQYQNFPLPSHPQWNKVFRDALATSAEGYAYVVSQYGQVVTSGFYNDRRSPFEPKNPNFKWGTASRINLASVSKPITAVAVLKLLEQKGRSVDDKFYPYIADKVSTVGKGVDSVTIRNLLTMKSGMVVDGSLQGDLWPFLNQYLKQGLVGTPGKTYAYSNTNFTILQAVVDQLSGQDYAAYLTQNVLVPMGIDPVLFNPQPDQFVDATLCYSGRTDQRPGCYWNEFAFVAPGGWITSGDQLIKFLIGLRNNAVLSKQATEAMLTGGLGWYPWAGVYGTYYHHNGGLLNGLQPAQQLNTGIVRFTDGYDAVLLVNSPRGDIINLIVKAFETR